MAELVDALVSEASGETRGSSNLLGRTKRNFKKLKMKKILPAIIMLLLSNCLIGCKYSSSYSAIGLFRNNTSSQSSASFYSLQGRLVFNMKAKDSQTLSYTGKLDTGSITVYYDNSGEKTELFSIEDNEIIEEELSPLNKGNLYIIIQTNGKSYNGSFTFEII